MNPGDHLAVREVGGPNGRDWIAFIEAGKPPDRATEFQSKAADIIQR
jgi:hypothetical protein